jgi:putative nucleotidyltransferase with HDIG domain
MDITEKIVSEISRIEEISTLPQVMQEVLAAVMDESTSAQDLAREISSDPALTGKILKIANSAFYGFHRRISSMAQAIVILGYREIRSIAVTLSISDMFRTRHSRSGLDRMKLWEHSIATAILADCIRERCCPDADGAFVCGLLHDMGIFVFDQYFSDEWAPVYIQCIQQGDRPLVELEQEILGLSHAKVGYLLAERWNLPAEVSQAIAYHHIAPEPQTSSLLEAVVYVANAMVKQWGIGFSGDSVEWPVTDGVREMLRMSEEQMPKIEALFLRQMNSLNALVGYMTEQSD